MAIKFLHTPKNKKFSFKPRYYNEQKEELEKRIQKIKREMGVEDDDTSKPFVPNIKGQMRGYFHKNVQEKRKSTVRLVVILIILFVVVYFLLYF
ncbi:hypothetical protein ACFLSE_05005 [Bacteroidota bacterium]